MVVAMTESAHAVPAFARQYNMSCRSCHAAFPRLNGFGESFRDQYNYQLQGWKDSTTVQEGDDRLALQKAIPFALRLQSYVQARTAEEVTPGSGFSGSRAEFDFQTPYLLKLIGGAPITDQLSFYTYAIFAERGENGVVTLEEMFVRYSDLLGSGIGIQLGQFQISELMFARELRLTFQDYLAYRYSGITYDRGVQFGGSAGPIDIAVGFANGNGSGTSAPVNSAGYGRPDRSFDNNAQKVAYARFGGDIPKAASLGLFALTGLQRSAGTGVAAGAGGRDTLKQILGLDVSGTVQGKLFWFGQYLWNGWDDFLDDDPTRDFRWNGGFLGVDWIVNDRWSASLLYNGAGQGDFAGTGTIYEGLETSVLTAGVSYYLARNFRFQFEGGIDFLPTVANPNFVGHLTKENYVLFGLDAAI